MKILAVSDMVVDRLYSATVAERFSDVKMVLGCGDLPYDYLEFLVTALNVPLMYVPGNHDPGYDHKQPTTFAQGGDNLDLRVASVCGLTIAGIGGSLRYRPCCENQYTQFQMYSRLARFLPRLLIKVPASGRKLDIVIAHSPPRGIHDDDDLAHTGFTSFREFIRIFKPRYFLHGHTLAYKDNIAPPMSTLGTTSIINVNPYRIIEV